MKKDEKGWDRKGYKKTLLLITLKKKK